MAVTYTVEQKKLAKIDGQSLATIAVAGIEFQGPVSEDERDALLRWLLDFQQRRRANAANPKGTPLAE
ncbi:hypothetical protein GobsT_31190 [Gemmata obscuriglobus]|uniref:Uncharacterized protein n=1 Tax=Gemmata obscuriglobus TaxID=114 RepID=A0A2Z3H303_9BACT|nr:hypothetical protein [Gemmata obscuriglobus]AWM38692.1 hypothetical protein C1280_17995 [Gemmata obscuriglobus]QEG28342.1 hypothetical protein GobsT_31190 [Gemmata obscuriglobus]VTS06221.1 unnamed protein product [Gemmata obscuriglobus UQM 2246]